MINDSKRRASDALIEAFEEGFTLREILELAMDDATTSPKVSEYLSRAHDDYLGELSPLPWKK